MTVAGAITLSIMIDAVNKGAAAYKQAESGLDRIKNSVKAVTAHIKMMAVYAAFNFLKKGAENFMAVEKAAAQSATIISGSVDTIKQFSDAYSDMSEELPKTAEDLGAGHYKILSLGITDTAESLEVLELAAKASVGQLISVEKAAESGTMMMNAFGMSMEDLTDIYDLQNHIIDMGNIAGEELANIIGVISSAAVGAGQSMQDMGANAAFFTARGMESSKTATVMRGMYNALVDPDVLKKLVNMGINVTDLTDAQIKESRTLQVVRDRMNEVKNAMGDMVSEIETQKGVLGDLTISISESSFELTKQEGVLQNLASEYQQTQGVMSGFQDQMNAFNLQSRKNSLIVMQIRRKSEKESRELTDREKATIEGLEGANDDLRISTEQLGIKQAESALKAEEQRDAMDGQAVKVQNLETTLQGQITALDTANTSLTGMTEKYNGLGVELDSANEEWARQISLMGDIRPLSGIITDLTATMDDYTEAERKIKIAEIFTNVRARTGITLMTENLGAYTGVVDSFNDSTNYANKTQNDFNLYMETTISELEVTENTMTSLAKEIFDNLKPAFDIILEIVKSLTGWLGDNTWAVYLLVGAYVTWKLISIAVTFWTGAVTIAQWLFNAALYACPLVWIVLAILAVIAVIVLLIVYWDEITAALKTAGEAIGKFFAAIGEGFAEIGKAIGRFFAAIGSAIGDFFGSIGSAIGGFFADIGSAIGSAVASAAGWAWDMIKSFAGGIADGAWKVIKAVGGFIADIASAIGGLVSDAAGWAWDMVKEFVAGIWDGVKSAAGAVKDAFLTLVGEGWIWDIRANDMMGQGWGEDFVKWVASGVDIGVAKNKNKLSMPVEMVSPKLIGGAGLGSEDNRTNNNKSFQSNDQYKITVNVTGTEAEQKGLLNMIKKETRRQTRRDGEAQRWYNG